MMYLSIIFLAIACVGLQIQIILLTRMVTRLDSRHKAKDALITGLAQALVRLNQSEEHQTFPMNQWVMGYQKDEEII